MLYPWISTGQSFEKTDGFGMRALEFDKTVDQKEGHTTARHFQAMHLTHDMSQFLFISRTQDDGSHLEDALCRCFRRGAMDKYFA